MIEFVLSLLLQFSMLQGADVNSSTSVNENKGKKQTTTTTTTTTETTDPSTTDRIGSGGWDDRD